MVTGAPLLCDALAAFDCELEEVIERHSHAIVIGRVVAARRCGIGDTLVYWRGDYHDLHHRSHKNGPSEWEPILGARNIGCG
jgi:flavin reductase (DIM6/NTAB) family NADH-FMN oxidoreductase RutF